MNTTGAALQFQLKMGLTLNLSLQEQLAFGEVFKHVIGQEAQCQAGSLPGSCQAACVKRSRVRVDRFSLHSRLNRWKME